MNETSLPEKENFYSHLNMEDITDVDYAQAKRVCEDFKIKKIGEYHDLYIQSDTLFLVDVFRTLEICVLKYVSLILQNFFRHLD